MAATVTRLWPQPDRLREEDAAKLRQMILTFPELPEGAVGQIIATIDRQTAAENGWTFVMLSPAQHSAVVDHLAAHSSRKLVALRLWALLFNHLRRDTGEIMLRREEMAEKLGTTPNNVSAVMSELKDLGAVSRTREKIDGVRGPGMVRYFMNPNVGTHLPGAARDKAQAEAPTLRLVP